MPIPRHTHAQVVNEINSPPSSYVKNWFDRRDWENGKKSLIEKIMATTKNEALKSSLNSHEAGQDNLNG